MLNVYETLDKFKEFHLNIDIIQPLVYANEFYPNDVGGYKLTEGNVSYYLLHYMEFDPNWKVNSGYYRTLESDTFFVPARLVEMAYAEQGNVSLAFIVDNKPRYLLPRQLKVFYINNDLGAENGYGELMIPVPIKMLNTKSPFVLNI